MSEKTSIILFGLTGHGKSSIANMLIQGDIYHNRDNSFKINDKVGGASVQIQGCTNDKFIVYDTIGVAVTSVGNVPHKKAVKTIRNYFSICEAPLNYIAFVVKKGRISEEVMQVFKIFKEIFKDSEKSFIIIITCSRPKWIDENIGDLRKYFENYPIIPVDFPFEEEDDDDGIAAIHQNRRRESIQRLTDRLSFLNYKGSKLQALSSFHLGKENLADEQLIKGISGAIASIILL
ncbi:1488_t:CDS:2 [Funneliformis mosseae]|uniref:1488_t:CDS:1 n=1 Tax=Funneliformis mosseae TaxID=27381 RepID=A0A9N9C156_FUNMO|nr:1488_t:CDS:2 [Funneliformis mosseae]